MLNKITNRKLHATLTKLGLMDQKAQIISSFTEGKFSHSSDLPDYIADNLVRFLTEHGVPSNNSDPLRKKVLSICHQLGWYARDNQGKILLKKNKPVLDFDHINKFCTEHGVCHKALNDHTYPELQKLVYQFNQVLKNTLK